MLVRSAIVSLWHLHRIAQKNFSCYKWKTIVVGVVRIIELRLLELQANPSPHPARCRGRLPASQFMRCRNAATPKGSTRLILIRLSSMAAA